MKATKDSGSAGLRLSSPSRGRSPRGRRQRPFWGPGPGGACGIRAGTGGHTCAVSVTTVLSHLPALAGGRREPLAAAAGAQCAGLPGRSTPVREGTPTERGLGVSSRWGPNLARPLDIKRLAKAWIPRGCKAPALRIPPDFRLRKNKPSSITATGMPR